MSEVDHMLDAGIEEGAIATHRFLQAALRGVITMGNPRQLEEALSKFNRHIDVNDTESSAEPPLALAISEDLLKRESGATIFGILMDKGADPWAPAKAGEAPSIAQTLLMLLDRYETLCRRPFTPGTSSLDYLAVRNIRAMLDMIGARFPGCEIKPVAKPAALPAPLPLPQGIVKMPTRPVLQRLGSKPAEEAQILFVADRFPRRTPAPVG